MRSLRLVVKSQNLKPLLLIISLVVSFGVLAFSIYNIKYSGKIFPNIYVAGTDVGALSSKDAISLMSENFKAPQVVKLVNQNQTFNLNTKDISLSYDFTKSVVAAYNIVRTGYIYKDLVKRVDLLVNPSKLGLTVNVDDEKLNKFISVVAGQDSQDPISASVKLVNSVIIVNPGAVGTEVDQAILKEKIISKLSFADEGDIAIPINTIDNTLNSDEVQLVKNRVGKYLGKNLQIKRESNIFNLTQTDIIKLLNLKGGFDETAIDKKISEIVIKVERDPQNPKFTFDNGRVTEFVPALDGIEVDKDKLKELIITNLENLEKGSETTFSIDIPVTLTPPEVTTDKVNNLGIKELIGRGTSNYFHSIPGRVHNVALAASKINGTLVKPGDTFSFNDTLGDVSAFTGYQQAYIISEGKTILGDGGGVCQVSTTLFRALLNAGLPITERSAHAYRVGYYEQNSPPGLDATVYGPTPDLKFTNDTGNYILIEAASDPAHYFLAFELYGTNDGRVATITKPTVTNISPALPTVYQDDPTLPVGTLKQTDFSAAGATVTFRYSVTKGNETIFQKTFVSNYRPWAAVYLRGTGPAI